MVLYGSYLETNILKMYQLLQIDCLKALCLFRMKTKHVFGYGTFGVWIFGWSAI